MSLRSSLVRSAVAGLLLTALTVVGIAILAFAGFPALLTEAVAFGAPAAHVLHLLIPSAALYTQFPEGGGPAYLGLALLGALIQLFIALTALSYVLRFAQR